MIPQKSADRSAGWSEGRRLRDTNELSQRFKVELTDKFASFLRPNRYVDYSNAINPLAKVKELTKGITDPLKQPAAICDHIVEHSAATIRSQKRLSGSPVHSTGKEKKGGADNAALMESMVRSLGIPCKLVAGYAVSAYCAWISI